MQQSILKQLAWNKESHYENTDSALGKECQVLGSERETRRVKDFRLCSALQFHARLQDGECLASNIHIL